ncbi:MAG: AAA family ATPase [Dehalococcoidia bacterium]|nr:AAA family ATPase [Dehalococcoidia bacterium]
MRLHKARVRNFRSIRETEWFTVQPDKTILVGPNEAGKTVLLKALQQINPPDDVPKFVPLRDYPRSELSDLQLEGTSGGHLTPRQVTVVEASFVLDDEDEDAVAQIDARLRGSTYRVGRRLDNTFWHTIDGGPTAPKYGEIRQDLVRLASHVDMQDGSGAEGVSESPHRQALSAIVDGWVDATTVQGEDASQLAQWLDEVFPLVEEGNATQEKRFEKLDAAVKVSGIRDAAVRTLRSRMPVFVYFSNYFRVHPRLHLRHLADRIEQDILDDDEYDRGNSCLLALLGFSARELSDLGEAPEPGPNDIEAKKAYQDQLDTRSYRLNAASIRLTEHINEVWRPDARRGEAARLRVEADRQYLKVVVEDDLGVEVELDQRSEGFQWLVSFFVVFFAEARDRYKNAVLLLDEPGLSLHGLKQREFRTTVSRLAKSNQLLYTTHSPFMVGPDELDLVRVVEMTDRKVGTKVHTTLAAGDSASLLPLQEALGYDLAQSLFSQQRNLVLEGLTDYWYLEATAALLKATGETELSDKISLVPANAAGKVVYFATILHANKLKVAALLDSDAAGDAAAQVETLLHTLGNKNILRTADAYDGTVERPEIEDLLRDTLIKVAADELQCDVSKAAAQQPTRPIVDIFESESGKGFSKYALAKAYLRWSRDHDAGDLTETERTQWTNLIEAINKALR